MKSMRARLTAAVMMPLLALALTFGGITCWMIHRTFSTTADRILVGSATTLSRAIVIDDGGRTGLVPMALDLLRGRITERPVYSVYQGEKLLAGNPDLRPPEDYRRKPAPDRGADAKPLHEPASFPRGYRVPALIDGYSSDEAVSGLIQPTYLHDGVLGGRPVRIATEIRYLSDRDETIVVQAADFLDDREAYELTYYLRVGGAGVLVAMIALLLFYGAITWGLGPFASLTAQIEAARRHPGSNVRVALAEEDPLEARMLGQAFNDLMARTERAIDSLRQFTANASHQLRTPLAIMRVHADVLARYGPGTRQGDTALFDILAAVESLDRLLTQLIALARMDEQAGDDRAHVQIDLVAIAADAVATRVTHPDAARMDVGFESAAATLPALGNAMLAAEIVSNLLDNAIRYNREDGAVTVRVLERGGHPVIEVEDDGPGIGRADREKVWERFYRAPLPGGPSGSGLGLPIVRALGERIGATISLEDGREGRGLRAVVVFARTLPSDGDTASDFPEIDDDFPGDITNTRYPRVETVEQASRPDADSCANFVRPRQTTAC
ncbi:sensor histidine kinase N-terminal domain-containing protein [Novosphingobium sp. YJ-S2-02]|uniref:histidine kinase n=1 Tax=Novosphingobium aureum TaxID=2792964 RepID=A0A931MKJ3_9SPHN|nr:ATP-binding protein [Novosphingobium aureum]MBH0112987.1 sensor histidine kinase N-terminal domain-containing protein [Novosphingobium aureum]